MTAEQAKLLFELGTAIKAALLYIKDAERVLEEIKKTVGKEK